MANEYVCAECGHEQNDFRTCQKCSSFRVILQTVAQECFGEDWRKCFNPELVPESPRGEIIVPIVVAVELGVDPSNLRLYGGDRRCESIIGAHGPNYLMRCRTKADWIYLKRNGVGALLCSDCVQKIREAYNAR